MTESNATARREENRVAEAEKPRTRSAIHGRLINGWPLFWCLTVPMVAAIVSTMVALDLSNPAAVSEMIGYSVRWAVPFIYLVVAASAVPVLFPGNFTRWWSRNRRYIGLVFAVAMAWQGLFIFIISTTHASYYYDEIYFLRDELEGTSGYLFLAAMVITSFRFGRQFLSGPQWKVLHRCGIYFLWAYPFSVYWWNLFYYGNAQTHDYLFYWAGFLAFLSRIAAWGKRRAARAASTAPRFAQRASGTLLIVGGLMASATGAIWRPAITGFLTGPAWSANLELWLPFWPFEPFLPLFAIGIGTWLITGALAADARPQQTRTSAT